MNYTVTNSARANSLGLRAQAREPKVFSSALLTNYKKDVDIDVNEDVKHYGLTKSDYDFVQLKLNLQKQFLNSSFLYDKWNHVKIPLSTIVVSAYHSPDRYYGEVQNRVNTLVDEAKRKNLQAVFMTITLPSEFHKMKTKNAKLVPNEKYNDILPHEASKALTKMFTKLRHDRSYKELSKTNRMYFRVNEPHKDGTPHTHILLFIPPENVSRIEKAFKHLFNPKTNTIETVIENATSYVMKYINKTLPLSKNKDTLTEKDRYMNAWYSKNRIIRFNSSRTLAPLQLYRLLHNRFSLRALTKLHNEKSLRVMVTLDTEKIMEIFDGEELIYCRNENVDLQKLGGNYREDNLPTNDSALEVA